MRLDENYLRELELWPMFALRADMREQGHAPNPINVQASDTAAISMQARAEPSRSETQTSATPPSAGRMRSPVAEAYANRTAAPVPRSEGRPRPLHPPQPTSVEPVRAAPAPVDPARVARIAQMDWPQLQAEIAQCQACGLCARRKQAVMGVGATPATWLFVGEAPGEEEDAQGEPFVGQAGKLLDAMLKAINLRRGDQVYIANVVKCRPPGNRTPTPEEAAACAPFLDRQIALLAPKLMVALGKTAALRLTSKDQSMAQLRGESHDHQGIPVRVTYHPSYLLRTPTEKAKAWEDLLAAAQTLERLDPAQGTSD